MRNAMLVGNGRPGRLQDLNRQELLRF